MVSSISRNARVVPRASAIQDERVMANRARPAVVSLLVSLLGGGLVLFGTGCASSLEGAGAGERTLLQGETARGRETTNAVVVETRHAPEAPAARPRLSQTITLGQGANESVYGSPAPAQASNGSGSNVTVNNNITVVQQQPPAVYGGYGGYGYGYGGYGGGRAYGGREGTGAASTSSRSGAWAPTGWEGAGRTAAPGQTPGVGGNFAPAPSFGPRQMK